MNKDELPDTTLGIYDNHMNGLSQEASVKRHRHRHSSSRYWIAPLLIGIVLETLIIIGLLVWVSQLEQDKRSYGLREEELVQRIEAGKSEFEALKLEFDKVKNERLKAYLPNLTRLKVDEVMEINKEYVKSGIFRKVGKKDKKLLEYNLVLENKSQIDIFPRVELLFFNGTGFQVGVSRIGYDKDGEPTREILERGEIRSFASNFEITHDAEPEYFMVKIRND